MSMRFVVTGSGRCGTTYLSRLLTVAGIPCGHESVFDFRTEDTIAATGGPDWRHYQADSSWQAVPLLERFPHPTVLVVRHPLRVVNSLLGLGFFDDVVGAANPVHATLRGFAPEVYEQASEQDAALYTWLALNRGALRHAELLFRVERFGVAQFTRLLRWAGVDDVSRAPDVLREVGYVANDFPNLRDATGRRHEVGWADFEDRELVGAARDLAWTLGYGETP
ncbi:hypothetical protein QTQ03_25325 [Micromonospora sp. WMMA1363]|uniref:hypothetical protein n=1 Tax=Micromonospora sp. WMMA1363 TaxID=3053985 RepID=UPI00259CC467|nr:hypothetical protein [Micromonospora sp. WMMA1363]MDM4722757.1 hypothetical protein [Micromonospora sp. WMMA1363]